uniref:Uncharacterized protein n=1 Tax=Arundo donax TaxID=35708 RepID=A0A0A8YC49_ARUDO
MKPIVAKNATTAPVAMPAIAPPESFPVLLS